MDEYQIEIRDLRRRLATLRAAEAAPDVIEDYEAQLRNLVALYEAATATHARGVDRADLRHALEAAGYGAWSLPAVYSFVYDVAMEAELDGRDLANIITHTDYAAALTAPS